MTAAPFLHLDTFGESPLDATALIAEDEPLLAEHLRAELGRLWPRLRIVASVGDGASAVERALALRPQVLFLDIRMPGLSGLEAAQALAEEWPGPGESDGDGGVEGDAPPFPLLVFVTAYDQYAVAAFERAAVDYVLKPVQPARLAQTCARLQAALEQRAAASVPGTDAPPPAATLDAALAQLRLLLAAPGVAPPPAAERLRVVQAGGGSAIHLVPIDKVLYFEAADKYLRVVTAEGEHLIRTSLRELLPQLDPERFWQIHRGTVVRCDAVAAAVRDASGRLTLTLVGHADRLPVSRLYAQRFRAM